MNPVESLERRRLLSAGDVDVTFGVGGYVEHVNPTFFSAVTDTVVLSDGRLLTAGYHGADRGLPQGRYILRRLHTNGSLDTTFGSNGTVYGHFTTDPDDDSKLQDIAVTADGKIYGSGYSSKFGYLLARFTADGAPDTTFGASGYVRIPHDALQVDLQPDGKILTVNEIGGVSRFLPNGAVDVGFGEDGTVREPVPTTAPARNTAVVRVQGDGKLLVGSQTPAPSGARAALARLNADGSLDASFGVNGQVLDAIPGGGVEDNRISDIVLLPGGKFLAGGTMRNRDDSGGFRLARYNANGTIDTTYGASGVAFVSLGDVDLTRLLLDADGNAVIVGNAGASITAARVTRDGEFDETFGRVTTTGDATADMDVYASSSGAVIQPDGKLLVVGARQFIARSGRLRHMTFGVRFHTEDDGAASPVRLDAARQVVTIDGTPGPDLLLASERGGVVFGRRAGFGRAFDVADVRRVEIDAGDGDDLIHATAMLGVAVSVVGGLGVDRIGGGGGNDTLEGSGGVDFIDGGAGNDLLNGGGGNDALRGQDGDDTLHGAAGDDEMRGGAGTDLHDGGPGNDVEVDIDVPDVTFEEGLLRFLDSDDDDDQVSLWADGAGGLVVWVNGSRDTIDIALVKEIRLAGMGGNDLLKLNPGLEIRSGIHGGSGNDTVVGGAAPDEIYGVDGDDVMTGNAGPDYMFGHDGNDVVRGGAGNDYLDGAAGNDRIEGNIGDDTLVGGAAHDVLIGGAGIDSFLGMAGNDVLIAIGDDAADTVDGGLGTDTAEADEDDNVLEVETTE